MAKIVNVVAVADMGVVLNLAQLVQQFPDKVLFDTVVFRRAIARCGTGRSRAILFENGKIVLAGATSPTAAKKDLRRLARELGIGRVGSFRVVNIVAQWSLAKRAENETRRLNSPKAFVRVSRGGHVFCAGVKNRADLNRVYKTMK
jgi:TATA-box binding protein (TBP) (component of TFIID and TFIIIB)